MGLISRMGSVPMNPTGTGLICEAPQDQAGPRAGSCDMSGVTEDERRIASEAIEWLRSKQSRSLPDDRVMIPHDPRTGSTQPAANRKRKT